MRAWGEALRGAIRGADDKGDLVFDDREPALVATTPAQAYALAADLGALIDDMIIEGASWDRLEALAPETYDSYWRITLDFLKIAVAHWPRWLDENGLIDRARRVSLLIEAEIGALEARAPRGPTIIAGSTGANRATARLIAAIARSAQGAVVLPGLDLNLDDQAFAMIGAADEAAQGLSGHPQALLHRLIDAIGVRREQVVTLGAPPPPLLARAAFLSEALRPAGSTDRWRDRDKALSPPAVAAALEDVAILVADNENEEALALAIAMRETLETPGKTAALITPEPAIARRVSAELARWGIEVEDSAGRTLGQSEAGALARLVLQAAIAFTPLSVLALLAHPAARFGRARADLDSAARALELGVFRAAPLGALDNLDQAFAAARSAAARPSRASGDPGDHRDRAPDGRAARARHAGRARAIARTWLRRFAARLPRSASGRDRRRPRHARGRSHGAAGSRRAERTDGRMERDGERRLSLRSGRIFSAFR